MGCSLESLASSEDFFKINRKGGNALGAGSSIDWTEDQKEYIKQHYAQYFNVKALSQLFEVSQETMRVLLHKMGIRTKSAGEKGKEKHPRNSSFFQVINSPSKAYWLGFLYADGYVSEKYNSIRINLQKRDEDHLQKFISAIQATNTKIKYSTKFDNDVIYEGCYITICDKQMVNDLIRLGCVQNKSLILRFPNENQVPTHLLSHFIRGYFDGDGCIWYSEHSVSHLKYFNVSIEGTEDMLNGIQNYLSRNHCQLEKNTKHFTMHVCGNRVAYNALSLLYQDSYPDIELTRKREKYDELVKQRAEIPTYSTKIKEVV